MFYLTFLQNFHRVIIIAVVLYAMHNVKGGEANNDEWAVRSRSSI